MDVIERGFHLFGKEPPEYLAYIVGVTVWAIVIPLSFFFLKSSRPRQSEIPPYRERVLILGASSGVGRSLALEYARRGCRDLVLVARRQTELKSLVEECEKQAKEGEEWDQAQEAPDWRKRENQKRFHIVLADCKESEDVDRLLKEVKGAIGGLDTLHICFGVSALRPLLGIAGIDPIRPCPPANAATKGKTLTKTIEDLSQHSSASEVDVDGLEAVRIATDKACQVNVTATAMVLTAFIPLLQFTSKLPSIVLISSVAAHVPAPTRSLYGATKAAQSILFQAVALESDSQSLSNPKRSKINFVSLAPGTILSDFRKSAVDGPPEESGAKDSTWDGDANGNGNGGSGDALTTEDCSNRAIDAVDRFQGGIILIPKKYKHVRLGLLLFPKMIQKMAHKKYEY